MTNKDIIILYTKEFSLPTEEYIRFDNYMRKTNEDKDMRIIIVPTEIVVKVERL